MAKRTQSPSLQLALLRGVNVGGKNCLPMSELAEMFIGAGCASVRTYIASGNVLFTASASIAEQLPGRIATQITTRFGYQTPVILRTADQLQAVVANNPFPNAAGSKALHVLFLAGHPDASRVAALSPDRSPPDSYAVLNREVYLNLPNGIGKTKLTNAYFDSKLATVSTARNWNTVLKLSQLLTGS